MIVTEIEQIKYILKRGRHTAEQGVSLRDRLERLTYKQTLVGIRSIHSEHDAVVKEMLNKTNTESEKDDSDSKNDNGRNTK